MKKTLLAFGAMLFLAEAVFAGTGPQPRITPTGGIQTNGIVVWSNACRLYDVYVYNPTATNEYVMVMENVTSRTNIQWNSAFTPSFGSNGVSPRMGPWLVSSNSTLNRDFSFYGVNLDNCWIGISTTSNTFTSAVTNAFFIQAVYDNTTQ